MLHFKDILILALSTLIAIGAYLIKGFLKDIRTMQKDIETLKGIALDHEERISQLENI